METAGVAHTAVVGGGVCVGHRARVIAQDVLALCLLVICEPLSCFSKNEAVELSIGEE